MLMISVESVCC